MREIKFRGKRVDNGEWSYGFYIKGTFQHLIAKDAGGFIDQVAPETVGQFVGFKDLNNQEIYEGDICSFDALVADEGTTIENNDETVFLEEPKEDYVFGAVKYNHSGFFISVIDDNKEEFLVEMDHNTVVIGNVLDNPELLQ